MPTKTRNSFFLIIYLFQKCCTAFTYWPTPFKQIYCIQFIQTLQMVKCMKKYLQFWFIVYDLKSVGALKIESVAPIPEQSSTSTVHFSKVSGGGQVASSKFGRTLSFFEKHQFSPVRPNFRLATFNMCLLTLQENALLRSQFVLAWVQRISNFGSLDRRLILQESSLVLTMDASKFNGLTQVHFYL